MSEAVSETGRPLESCVWTGLYPGTVVSDEDPDRRGRVRVRADQVYGAVTEEEFIPDDALPWARVNMQAVGADSGGFWVPPVGSPVLVAFWGGDPEHPLVMGSFLPDAKIPAAFASSHLPGPMTRIIRTPGGQQFEMRWKPNEERVRLETPDGVILELKTSPAGPKATLRTPLSSVELDDVQGKVAVTTPGNLEATAGGMATAVIGGAATLTIGGALAATVTGAVSVTAGALLSLTAPSITLASSSGGGTATTTNAGLTVATYTGVVALALLAAVNLTLAGLLTLAGAGALAVNLVGAVSIFGASVLLGRTGQTYYKLLDERAWTYLAGHTHTGGSIGPGTTDPPVTPPLLAAVATADTKAS